jgi:hypothetical protein
VTDARATAAFLEVARAGDSPPAAVTFVGLEVATLNQLPADSVLVTAMQAEVLTPSVEDITIRASQLAAEALSATPNAAYLSQLAAEVLLRSEFDPCVHGPVVGCTTAPVAYRLRIRNAADDADALVVTSLATGADALIAEVPNIDGATFDPLTGKTTVGGATVLVIDAADGAPDGPIDETDRAVTKHLADDDGRSQLLGRKAYLEWAGTCDEDADFQPHFAGYVTSLALIDAITWEIGLAHSSRDDARSKVWADSRNIYLDVNSWLFGGPVSGDVPHSHASTKKSTFDGYWNAEVIAVYDTFIHLDIDENASAAFPPADLVEHLADRGWIVAGITDAFRNVIRWAQANAQKYFVRGYPNSTAQAEWEDPLTTGMGSIRGYAPRVDIQVVAVNGGPIAHAAKLMTSFERSVSFGGRTTLFPTYLCQDLGNHFYIAWANTDPVPQPDVGDVLGFYGRPLDVSPAAPGWIIRHPVEILRDVLLFRGYAVNSITDAKDDLGDLLLSLRVTDPPTVTEAIAMLGGMFGLGVRAEADGTRTIFCWRTRHDPVVTIGLDDLAGRAPGWWKTAENSRLFSTGFAFSRFDMWPGLDQNAQGDRALDGIVAFDEAPIVFQSALDQPAESRVQTYALTGMLLQGPDGDEGAPVESVLDTVAPWAAMLLDTFGDGAITIELDVLPTIAARIGEEVLLDLSPVPGFDADLTPVAQRGLPNRCLVIGDTPEPFGKRLTLLRLPDVEEEE